MALATSAEAAAPESEGTAGALWLPAGLSAVPSPRMSAANMPAASLYYIIKYIK
jgi:hypothetical protein